MDRELTDRIKALGEPIRAKGAMGRYVYGSRARGDHRPDSDIDVLVDYDSASGFGAKSRGGPCVCSDRGPH
jgi:uncharacterized protein